MVTLAALLFCLQACFIQSVFSLSVNTKVEYPPYYGNYGALGLGEVDFSAIEIDSVGFGNTGLRGIGSAGLSEYGFGNAALQSITRNAGVGPSLAGIAEVGVAEFGISGANIANGFGGTGNGVISVAGELPVVGKTAVAGQLPVVGFVEFTGYIPANGLISVAGNCGCKA